jgi:hypothetical protein
MQPFADLALVLRNRRVITLIIAAVVLLANQYLGLNLPADLVQWGSGVVMAFLLGDAYVEAKVHQAAAQASTAQAARPSGSAQ